MFIGADMLKGKELKYAESLSALIQTQTVSSNNQTDKSCFYRFHELLKQTFPKVFSTCELEDFNGSLLLCIRGSGEGLPILLMNHHDVVEAQGEWRYPAFSGTIAEGKVWGRGALDTKGGLFCMLQAMEELLEADFTPKRDVYFVSSCTEECQGEGASLVAKTLKERGIKFYFVIDEGGMIINQPIAGAKGRFAMVGTGEKGCADIKFIARSNGGHAAMPGKNTPLVRIGKFMAEVERKKLFKAKLSPTVCRMFSVLSSSMQGPLKHVFKHARLYSGALSRIVPKVSNTAGAMIKTTVAFTMAGGSQGINVLPQEAFVIANMRYSHHQGRDNSIKAITDIANKYNLETVVLDPGNESSVCSWNTEGFEFVESCINKVFPDVKVSPYILNCASDCRFMDELSESCLRFTPFAVDNEQLRSIHGRNENVSTSCLPLAVEFYKSLITEA